MADSAQASEAAKRRLDEESNEDGDKKPKISISLGQSKPIAAKPMGLKKPISISLGGLNSASQGAKANNASSKPQAGPAVTSVFNADDSESEEEMPPEAKMRMRNVGKDTPTSAGPLSFSKTNKGFTDQSKLWQAKAHELAAKEGVELASVPKETKETKDPNKQAENLAQQPQHPDDSP